jgi:hypothetical protein
MLRCRKLQELAVLDLAWPLRLGKKTGSILGPARLLDTECCAG